MPDHCRPCRVTDSGDIELWADLLLGATRTEMLVIENESRLDRLASHFLIASLRIRQLA